MSKTTFSGPVETIDGSFVINSTGNFSANGGDFTITGNGKIIINSEFTYQAGIIVNNGNIAAIRNSSATSGGEIVLNGGDVNITGANGRLETSVGGNFLSHNGFIGTIELPGGGQREASGVAMEVTAATGANAGIIGTAKAYSTNITRTAPTPKFFGYTPDGLSISTIYIDISGLSWGFGTPATFIIGRQTPAGEIYPAYLTQITSGLGHQMGEIIGGTMTCLVAPTTLYVPVGLITVPYATGTQGGQPVNQTVLVSPRQWQAGDILEIPQGAFGVGQFVYLIQGASPTGFYPPGTFITGLFKIEIYSVDF